MNSRELAFYRWFESFTLHPEADASPHYELATARKYIEKAKTGELFVTAAGWEWFSVRGAVIIARCDGGHHDYRPKTAFCEAMHCMWCGHCETRPCQECLRFYLGGTIEGGWDAPLEMTHDNHPRSTIHHGYA